jgi:hypothetical protein
LWERFLLIRLLSLAGLLDLVMLTISKTSDSDAEPVPASASGSEVESLVSSADTGVESDAEGSLHVVESLAETFPIPDFADELGIDNVRAARNCSFSPKFSAASLSRSAVMAAVTVEGKTSNGTRNVIDPSALTLNSGVTVFPVWWARLKW